MEASKLESVRKHSKVCSKSKRVKESKEKVLIYVESAIGNLSNLSTAVPECSRLLVEQWRCTGPTLVQRWSTAGIRWIEESSVYTRRCKVNFGEMNSVTGQHTDGSKSVETSGRLSLPKFVRGKLARERLLERR